MAMALPLRETQVAPANAKCSARQRQLARDPDNNNDEELKLILRESPAKNNQLI